MMIDPAHRALLWCVLDDALVRRLAPLRDCPGCESWIERGPCPRHQAGWATSDLYLALSARLEAAAPLEAWPLGAAEAQLVALAIPEALARRCGSETAVDAALQAAYSVLAGQLAAAAVGQ